MEFFSKILIFIVFIGKVLNFWLLNFDLRIKSQVVKITVQIRLGFITLLYQLDLIYKHLTIIIYSVTKV